MQRRLEKNILSDMQTVFPIWFWRIWICGFVLICDAGVQVARGSQVSVLVTNVHQIRLLASQNPRTNYSIHLTADVLWAYSRQGNFVLRDDSGAEELQMDLQGTSLEAGQRVTLGGNGTIAPLESGFRIGAVGAVVDNNGVHGMVEKSGAVFLTAGLNPLRLEWFNGVEKYGLRVEYEGPGTSRQEVPDSALFRIQTNVDSATSNRTNGLDFICTEAPAQILPDFNSTPVLKTGRVSNFDLSVITRPEHVAICFTGFIRVPEDGLYSFFLTSDDGSRLLVGRPTLQVSVIGSSPLPEPELLLVGQKLADDESGRWGEIEGNVTFASDGPNGLTLEMTTETGRVRAEIGDDTGLSPASLLNHRIRAVGFCQGAQTSDGRKVLGLLLVPGRKEITVAEPPSMIGAASQTNAAGLPLLTSAAQVHHLTREEAQRGYPVKIRGVITLVQPEHQAFTIQDGTRGIYVVDASESRSIQPSIGEFLEVAGTTDPSLFAPVVNATAVHYLGAGNLPEPIHPARDQLVNGSLDAQYVEIQGILSSIQPDGVILLTEDGRIKCDLRVVGLSASDLSRYEDALIRVRGCFQANWDYVTHKVKTDEIRVYGAHISVDQAAPGDLFSMPRKPASALFLFDPQASVFQRVKVSGQIIHVQDTECFMMDGDTGLRFITKRPEKLTAGDLVEVVGFPEFNPASPVLREGVVRVTGHADLPKPKPLGPDDLAAANLDSTLVLVQAILVNQRTTAGGQILEMRAGLRPFLASLPVVDDSISTIPAGSLLELTGTSAHQNSGQDTGAFSLLLNSAKDVVVLARPPWWTLEKLFVILGALACVLAVTVLWITQLRRKVDQRTAELEVQIRERQRVEQQHAMEQERARIAQDLHDELGSSLTEITMLGVRARSGSTPLETRGKYLEQIAEKSRQMVGALDEIVWAMNPTHDSVASMISYFSLYAERFLGLANITWQLEGPIEPDDHAVDSRHRHQLFLAFKEALTNIVRHSGATEVRLSFQVDRGQMCLTVTDNGHGWVGNGHAPGMDGVANMRMRMEKMRGRFDVSSKAGEGTVVHFELPFH